MQRRSGEHRPGRSGTRFPRSVRGVSQAIKQMELDLSLLSDDPYGTDLRLIWEASRFGIDRQLRTEIVGQGESQPKATPPARPSWRDRLVSIARFVRATTVGGWLVAPRNRRWLILEHPRRRRNATGVYEDIYTADLIASIPENRRVVLEIPRDGRHERPRGHRVWATEPSAILGFLVKGLVARQYRRIAPSRRALVRQVNRYLSRAFGRQVDCSREIYRAGFEAFRNRVVFRFLLGILRPRRVLLLPSYGKEGHVMAARDWGIPSVEVQHGVITDEHLGYATPSGTEKLSFPDMLLVFGDFWRDSVDWALPRNRVMVMGYPYLDRFRDAVRSDQHVAATATDTIVLISQGSIGYGLSKFAVALAGLRRDQPREIVYKLHPGEWAIWRRDYPWLRDAADCGLLIVVDGPTPSLYDLFRRAQWQVGVYSTAVYEGLAFGCRTILVDLPGVEYMDPLVAAHAVQVVRRPEEINWNARQYSGDLAERFFADGWQWRYRDAVRRLTPRDVPGPSRAPTDRP